MSESVAPFFSEFGDKTPTGQFTPDGQTLFSLTVTDAQSDLVRLWTPGDSRPRRELPEKSVYIHAVVSDDARHAAFDIRAVRSRRLPGRLALRGSSRASCRTPAERDTAGLLPDLVEALAGQRWGPEGMELLPWSDFYSARAGLATGTTGGKWWTWVHWFLADRLERTVTPDSSPVAADVSPRHLLLTMEWRRLTSAATAWVPGCAWLGRLGSAGFFI